MRSLTYVLACVACFAISNFSFGQSVDPLTGQAIVQIPLGGVNALDLGASVGIAHHGGALRVNEGPGSAGMGWSLVAGGSVTREVRGLPDDYNSANDNRKGWLHNGGIAYTIQNYTSLPDDDLADCTDEGPAWSYLNNTLAFQYDSEPDIYYFNAPGISGKFVFGVDGQPKLIPYQDLAISFSAGSFVIKTNTGTTYYFSLPVWITRQAEKFDEDDTVSHFKHNYNLYTQPLTFASSWNLTSISSATTGASVAFTYSQERETMGSQYITAIKPGYTDQVDTTYYIKDLVSPHVLNQITLKGYTISFSWANSLIQSVAISEGETGETKAYDFVYKSVSSSYEGQFPLVNKPFLMEVKQRNACTAFPSYAFSYHGLDTVSNRIPIPWKTGWGEDHYGFYNGQVANKNVPTVYFYQDEAGARRFRVTPISGMTYAPLLQGGNRSVNASFLQYGALVKISYPTGGVTNFIYEPNKYFDTSTNEELLGPGLRVASVYTTGGEAAYGKLTYSGASTWHTIWRSYKYVTSEGSTVTSGKILYPPVFAYTRGDSVYRSQTDLGPGSFVMYSRVKEEISGQGYRVYEFDVPNTYPDPSATVSKVASPSGTCTTGFLKNGAYTFPYAPIADWGFKRGMLKRVSEYTEGNVLTQERRMTYITPQANSSIKGLRYEAMTNTAGTNSYFFSLYEIPIQQSKILSQEIVKVIADASPADSIKTTTSYAYNAKNMVTSTTQTQADGATLVDVVKYVDDYAVTTPPVGDQQANAIYKMKTTNRYGEVIETHRKFTPAGGTEQVMGASLTVYKDYGTYVWPHQVKQLPQGQAFTPSLLNPVTQAFIADADYFLSTTMEYENGLPVTQTGTSQVISSTIYSANTTLPLASLIHCKAENVVYDDFEFTSTRSLSSNGTPPAAPSRTGLKAKPMNNTYTLTKTVVKGEDTYRISCWVYATQAGSLTVNVIGDTVVASHDFNYTALNQWTYLESELDVTVAPSTFTLSISSTSSALLDDFLALPKSARVSTQTHLPLTGPTSQTDDRGNSTMIEYDGMGRKMNVFDKNRNLVERTEYGLQRQGKIELKATFTANVPRYEMGEAITFTAAAPNCIANVTYNWTFIDYEGNQTTATGASIVKTFDRYGEHRITLTATSAGYATATFTEAVCVFFPEVGGVTLSVSPNTTVYQCSTTGDRTKTFTASIPGWNPAGSFQPQVTWFITDINGVWLDISYYNTVYGGATINGRQLTVVSPFYTYQVKAIISAPEFPLDLISPACNAQFKQQIVLAGVNYINNSPCQ